MKSSVRSAVLKPVPGAPMIRSAGMVQSVKYSSQVGEPLMPILRSLGPTAKPGSSRCTANAEMPLAPFSGSVTAMTVYQLGDAGVGDPGLGAVEHPGVAVEPGAGLHRRGVGAGLPLGQAVADHRLAGGDRGQHLLLHVLGRRQDDRHRAELVHRRDQRGAAVDPRDLLDHDAGGDRVGALAAVGLGDVGGVEAGRRQRLLRLDGIARLGVHLGGVRRDLPLGDVADRLPDRLVLVGQGVEPGVVTHG